MTAATAVMSAGNYMPFENAAEIAIPIGEESADSSGQENLSSETEDKMLEDTGFRPFNSRLISWMSLEVEMAHQKVYRTIPSPPPDHS